MKTFKDLQDDVLAWIGDSEDTGLMLTLTKDALNQAQRNLLTEQMYDFMLWPATETLTFDTSRKSYSLHPHYLQGLYFYNPTTDEWLEEIPVKQQFNAGIENPYDASTAQVERFMITGTSPVKRQPAAAGVLTITTTGGTESPGNDIRVRGINASGEPVTELFTSGGTWSSIVGTTSFAVVTEVVKTTAQFTRTINVQDASANTLLTLAYDEYGRQYRQLELIKTPQANTSIVYRFYRKPIDMVEDNSQPMMPEEFVQLLVYRALINLAGYSRATPQELAYWQTETAKLENNLRATYTQSRTLGSRQNYINYRERY